MVKPTRLDYCQYLLSSPINYTVTHFADHSEDFSHDMINRYLAGDCIPPRLVWENVKPHLVQVEEGYVIFDDTVLDKKHARHIELVRRQWQRPGCYQRHRSSYLCLCESTARPFLGN